MSDEESTKPKKPKVVVFGSLNVDHTLRVEKLPTEGETVMATGLLTCFGGKGANQALAAARAGAAVKIIGTVGVDDFGVAYRSSLVREGVDVSCLGKAVAKPTGSAFVAVDSKGENIIVVNPGANHAINDETIELHHKVIEAAGVLLMQLECALPAVNKAAEIARAAEVMVVINPSPLTDEFMKALVPCDVLIVNAAEAEGLGGAEKVCTSPFAKKVGLKMLVVTNGAKATRVFTVGEKGKPLSVVPPKVTAVDTVGAGDSFAGAFSVALVEGMKVRDAVKFANAAGAMATLQSGAQSAIPVRAEIEAYLGE